MFPSCCLIAWSANTGHTRRINATATMTTANYFQQPSSKKTALVNYMVHINNGGLTFNIRQDLFDAPVTRNLVFLWCLLCDTNHRADLSISLLVWPGPNKSRVIYTWSKHVAKATQTGVRLLPPPAWISPGAFRRWMCRFIKTWIFPVSLAVRALRISLWPWPFEGFGLCLCSPVAHFVSLRVWASAWY